MQYYEKLKELRMQNNMSQEQLAEQLHVTRQTVSKWEQGINQPDIFTLKQYATIFNITLDELVGDVQQTNNPANKHRKACKTLLLISTMFYIFCIITVFILFRFLQDTIPAHYNINGQIDRYGSKAEILFHLLSFTIFYAITLLTYLICKKNLGTPFLNLENTAFIVIFSIIIAIPVGYFAFVMAIYVPYLLEHSTASFALCILCAAGLLVAISSHPKITPINYIMGFRSKFTLTNPEAWVKVNRFCSICLSVAVALMIAANLIFISYWAMLGAALLLICAILITIVYHEVLRKKMRKNSQQQI